MKDTHTVLTELKERMEAQVSKLVRELDKLGSDTIDDYRLGQLSGITRCISLVEEKLKDISK